MPSPHDNNNFQKMSHPARKMPKANIIISTTTEERINSIRVGQDTLFISASTAIRKSAKAGKITSRYDTHRENRQQHAVGNHK